jgi:hypothetical protein
VGKSRRLSIAISSLLFAVVITAGVPALAGGVSNLLPNPEWRGAPQMPPGWQQFHIAVLDEHLFFQPEPGAVGDWRLMIDDPDKGVYGLASDNLHTEPGTLYTATVMARTEGNGQATLYLEFFDKDGTRIGRKNAHYRGQKWNQITVQETAPAGAEFMYVRLISQGAVEGKSFFRDVTLAAPEVAAAKDKITWKQGSHALAGRAHIAERVAFVDKVAQINQALKEARPGDMIVVRDGVYEGYESFQIADLRGTQERPITIAAESIGGVEFKGSLQFVTRDSSHVVIEGFVFSTAGAPGNRIDNGAVVIHDSDHIRVTRNHFALQETYGVTSTRDWVSVNGEKAAYNRIDHNLFENKQQNGSYISVNKMASDTVPTPVHTRIDHNHFRDMAPLGINGMETMRIGVGPRLYTPFDAHTVVEYNLFERTDGEKSEIISVKSSGNTIRYNTVLETVGSFTLRHGDRNQVYGNYFIGKGKSGAGGVRVYGKDNRVFNNYFEGLTRAVTLGNGGVNDISELPFDTGYVRINRADIAFNMFVDNQTSIESWGRDEDLLPPLNTRIANNLFYSTLGNHTINRDMASLQELDGVSWRGNMAHGPRVTVLNLDAFGQDEVRVADPGPKRNLDGVWYIDQGSSAQDEAWDEFAYITRDIEGKERDTLPDVGPFEQLGFPLLRGPLTPEDVGPYATHDRSEWSYDNTTMVALTDVQVTADQGFVGLSGEVGIAIDGVVTGPNRNDTINVRVSIDGAELFYGHAFPAVFTLNTWELATDQGELLIEAWQGDVYTRRIQPFSIRNIDVFSPIGYGEPIHGEWPVSVAIHVPPSVVEGVAIHIDDHCLFSGPNVPDNLTFDSTAFVDGQHTFTVRMRRTDGGVTEKSTPITVENSWQLIDEFHPPLIIFGAVMEASETVEKSAGWQHVPDGVEALFGDDTRLTSKRASDEYLVWETPQLTRVVVTVFSRSADIGSGDIILATSADANRYTDLRYDVEVKDQSDDGWYVLELIAEVSERQGNVGYLRLLLKSAAGTAPEIQLGEVRMTGRK